MKLLINERMLIVIRNNAKLPFCLKFFKFIKIESFILIKNQSILNIKSATLHNHPLNVIF